MPGINIRWPWSRAILEGTKTIETRSYPIPEKYRNVNLAIIETPGPRGKTDGGIDRSTIVGVLVFSECFKYSSREMWLQDYRRHQVKSDDPDFRYSAEKDKWGWVIANVHPLDVPIPAPSRRNRGIVFAKEVILGQILTPA